MGKSIRIRRVADLPLCDDNALGLLAPLGQAIWVYDFDAHRIRWANAAGLAFWSADTLAEMKARNLYPESSSFADRLEGLRRRLTDGATIIESYVLYPVGDPVNVTCRSTGVRFPDGAVGALVEAKPERADHEVSGVELRAVEAVRRTPLMISMMSLTGSWLMHNPAATALMDRLDQRNMPQFDNFLPLFVDQVHADRLRLRAIEDGTARGILQLVGAGERIHEVNLRRLTDPVTGKLSLMLVQQDVTYAQKLERRLEHALERERAIVDTQRHFLSLTTHEFRTPLSVIDSTARRIEKLIGDGNPAVHAKAQTIRQAVKRMSDAVDKTLAAARIESGRFEYNPVQAPLTAALERAIETMNTLHPGRHIDVALDGLPSITIDELLVEQIFENLLSNALKYSPGNQPVEIVGSCRDGEVQVSVVDHGIGIPATDLPQLCTRFFRSANAKGFKGTGIGLHTVDFFMKLHGGKLSVESVEGKGSTMTLHFPLPEAA